MSCFSIRLAGTVTNLSCHCAGLGRTQEVDLQVLPQEDAQQPHPLEVVHRLACRQQQLQVDTATPPAPVLQEA
jgi:hypothetical protein